MLIPVDSLSMSECTMCIMSIHYGQPFYSCIATLFDLCVAFVSTIENLQLLRCTSPMNAFASDKL